MRPRPLARTLALTAALLSLGAWGPPPDVHHAPAWVADHHRSNSAAIERVRIIPPGGGDHPAAATTHHRPDASGIDSAPPARASTATVRAVAAVGMTVGDIERAVAFYRDVLDFRVERDVEVMGEAWEQLQGVFGARMRVVDLRLGDERVQLTEYIAPRGRPIPEDARSTDQSFQHIAIVVRDMRRAYERLRAARVTHVSTAPQRLPDWNPGAGGIEAFYFRDPDGHVLELIAFPKGKGLDKWHRPTKALFLGIDHTAVGTRDTDASIAFYRDLLGMRVAGTSENHGTEQEHLNLVFGARLRITALRAADGPGIELLEYLTPRDGRPFPPDQRANDIAHWQTMLLVPDADSAAARLRAARARFISPGAVATAGRETGFARGVLVRDPDGHAMQMVERD
jgi:catechol 2,3-dioxygenase-like lactoylglutathione lyase family enzyme